MGNFGTHEHHCTLGCFEGYLRRSISNFTVKSIDHGPVQRYHAGVLSLGNCSLFSSQFEWIGHCFPWVFSAFLVSMFETSAHNALIIVSSVLVLWECQPRPVSPNRWKVHWKMTMLLALLWMCWLSYVQVFWTELEAKCSWWYITEYFLFWSMYLLVYWRIPLGTTLHDQFTAKTQLSPSGATTEQFYTGNLEETLSF